MTDSYTMTPTVTEPVQTVEEMTLSLERVMLLLAGSNSDYMDYVVGELKTNRSLHRVAFNVWCINQIVVEKLDEIHKVLAEAESGLLALRTVAAPSVDREG